MKRIVIVNNNLKVGGVQKSLINLLWAIYKDYKITLVLFDKTTGCESQLPEGIELVGCSSLYRFLGISQSECARPAIKLVRGFLVLICRVFGRSFAMRLINLSQPTLMSEYDIAISYLQNGDPRHFYGGVNEFVLAKVKAKKKFAFLHCDYLNCGANDKKNNKLYHRFDKIIACSDGCKESFIKAIPELASRCMTVRNFHRIDQNKEMALQNPVIYSEESLNVVIVGRLAHEKAVDRAIKAVAYVKKHSIPIALHIIGSGSMEADLKHLVEEYEADEYICFHGEQQNPYRFMKNADLLLITSYHEAAPMVIDEARMIGIPTLTVETTSSKEMILPYQNGWICKNDQNAINAFLLKLAMDRDSIKQTKERLIAAKTSNEIAYQQFHMIMKV